jgi:hypothetical protein
MKTKSVLLFVLSIISLTTYTYSQDVFSLDNAKWTELLVFDYESVDGNPIPEERYISYSLHGDSIIDGIKRHKLYFSPDIEQDYSELTGFIHTDAEKVYFRLNENLNPLDHYLSLFETENKDLLLYDFSLEIGAPYPGLNSLVSFSLSDIDNVLLGNIERKRFSFSSDSPIGLKLYWIEGMGSTQNLFDPIEIRIADLYHKRLICFSQNDEVLWLNPDFPDCDAHKKSDIAQIKPSFTRIYPNPMYETGALITSSSPLQQIQVYTINGSLILNIKAKGKLEYPLYKQSLAVGMYYVKITLQDGRIETKELIIK